VLNFCALWNPGAQISGQKVFWEKIKTKVKKDESLHIKYQQYLLDANVGFFYDNPTYWAIFNNYIIQYRDLKEKGKYISYGLGLGYMRTFLPETYIVAANGNITKATFPGNWYFAPEYTIGIGRLWKRNSSRPWKLQLHGIFLTNYNLGLNILFNIEYGFVFGYKSKEKEAYDY